VPAAEREIIDFRGERARHETFGKRVRGADGW
jgi:hypothetical protein